MAILLKEIDRDNFSPCIKLDVGSGQKDFVASNAVSIAQSKVYPHMVPLAVYSDDKLVGFVMYGRDPETLQYWIVRLMIDAENQGRGLGRAAAVALIDLLKQKENCDQIFLCVVPENTVAQKLYLSIGFEPTGAVEDGEIVMRLSLANNFDPISEI